MVRVDLDQYRDEEPTQANPSYTSPPADLPPPDTAPLFPSLPDLGVHIGDEVLVDEDVAAFAPKTVVSQVQPDEEIETGMMQHHGPALRTDPFAVREGKTLTWTNVNMTLSTKDGERNLLDNVWGEVPRNNTTAIMGPSGAG